MDNVADLGIENMPQYDPYEDGSQNGETFPTLDEDPEATHDCGNMDFYVEILLFREDKMARGSVLHQSMILIITQLVKLLRTLSWIYISMKGGIPGEEIT